MAVAAYHNSLETRIFLAIRLTDYISADLPIAIAGGTLQNEFLEDKRSKYCSRRGEATELADKMLGNPADG